MSTGIFIISIGILFFIAYSKILGCGLILFGILGIYCVRSVDKKNRLEIEEASKDRSDKIICEIGGIDNIDINLSKYSNESQLIVLKNKTIHIGHNNYEIEKIINFDDINKLDVQINSAKFGTAHQYSKNKVEDIIKSITVYIHTNEYTEELVFKYCAYELEKAQSNYNEILKGLSRLKVMLGDYSDIYNLDKTTSVTNNEKSIPEQIKEYKELLDINAITKEEFEMKKKELLSK